jgi:SAM-dependent methyltransferase
MYLPPLRLPPEDHDPASRDCPVCGVAGREALPKADGYAYLRCGGCRLLFLSPRPREAALRERYRTTPLEDPEANAGHLKPARDRVLEALAGDGRRGGRLLDVGCGWGHFVVSARERGWMAEGVEISEPAIAYARIRHGLLLHRDLPPGPYEAVTLLFVLEHLHDPVGMLEEVRSRLARGGRVASVTPWTAPLARWAPGAARRASLLETPWHLSDFGPRALRAAFRRAGLRVVSMGPAGTGPRALNLAGRMLAGFTLGRLHLPGLSLLTVAEALA